MHGDVIDGSWVFIQWVYPGERKYTAYKELRKIEKEIRTHGLKGWYARSEKSHTIMHNFLTRFEAKPYGEDEESVYFKKEVS